MDKLPSPDSSQTPILTNHQTPLSAGVSKDSIQVKIGSLAQATLLQQPSAIENKELNFNSVQQVVLNSSPSRKLYANEDITNFKDLISSNSNYQDLNKLTEKLIQKLKEVKEQKNEFKSNKQNPETDKIQNLQKIEKEYKELLSSAGIKMLKILDVSETAKLPDHLIFDYDDGSPLQSATQVDNIDISKLQHNAKPLLGIGSGNTRGIFVKNKEQAREAKKKGAIPIYVDSSQHEILDKVLEKAMSSYISYRLDLAKNKDKDAHNDDKDTYFDRSSHSTYQSTRTIDDLTAQKPKPEVKLLNFDAKTLLQTIVTVQQLIIEEKREEEKTEAAEKKRVDIEVKEEKRAERREEIKKGDIAEIAGHRAQVESEVKAKETGRPVPQPSPKQL